MSKEVFKSGFVSIIGRPNVGKSTLLNQILQNKLAIVTPKAQTTRNRIQGIYTTDKEQIIFIDTPGVHKPQHELGAVMNQMALSATDGIDVILLLVEADQKIGPGDRYIIEQLEKVRCPVILVINKIDKVIDNEELKERINQYRDSFQFNGGITISAETGFNCMKLISMIIDLLPNGPMYYPEDQILDQPERFVVAEIIREKVLLNTKEEVPHSVAVTIERFKTAEHNDKIIEINATIIVERKSQKKIIIGSGGQMIKTIGTSARKDIVNFLGNKVFLELFVKVEDNWRNKKSHLREYGYFNDNH